MCSIVPLALCIFYLLARHAAIKAQTARDMIRKGKGQMPPRHHCRGKETQQLHGHNAALMLIHARPLPQFAARCAHFAPNSVSRAAG